MGRRRVEMSGRRRPARYRNDWSRMAQENWENAFAKHLYKRVSNVRGRKGAKNRVQMGQKPIRSDTYCLNIRFYNFPSGKHRRMAMAYRIIQRCQVPCLRDRWTIKRMARGRQMALYATLGNNGGIPHPQAPRSIDFEKFRRNHRHSIFRAIHAYEQSADGINRRKLHENHVLSNNSDRDTDLSLDIQISIRWKQQQEIHSELYFP